mmetsp:Transcript_28404/g.69137  ORF Transcript_28404/g.69137 Transcript_28404/m.69137 type:complete len:207 (+) Transcript_28404:755-1375(+)
MVSCLIRPLFGTHGRKTCGTPPLLLRLKNVKNTTLAVTGTVAATPAAAAATTTTTFATPILIWTGSILQTKPRTTNKPVTRITSVAVRHSTRSRPSAAQPTPPPPPRSHSNKKNFVVKKKKHFVVKKKKHFVVKKKNAGKKPLAIWHGNINSSLHSSNRSMHNSNNITLIVVMMISMILSNIRKKPQKQTMTRTTTRRTTRLDAAT